MDYTFLLECWNVLLVKLLVSNPLVELLIYLLSHILWKLFIKSPIVFIVYWLYYKRCRFSDAQQIGEDVWVVPVATLTIETIVFLCNYQKYPSIT